MELTSTTLRLLAHVASFGVIVAAIGALSLTRKKNFNMRHWYWLAMSLSFYAAWFFLLSISIRDTEFLKRSEIAWLLGSVEMTGAATAWTWFALTMRATFRIVPIRRSPEVFTLLG
jgi:hypothetical protein